MRTIKNNFLLGGLVILIIVSYFYFSAAESRFREINSFEACVQAGFRVHATYPEECRVPGKVFINPNQTPQKETIAPSLDELRINGFKNTTYQFEGTSVTLTNGTGTLIANPLLKRASFGIEYAEVSLPFDVNNDGKVDTVVLLKTVGTSTEPSLFYLTTALSLNTGYLGTNLVYVDQSLASSTLVYKNGEIVLTYVLPNKPSSMVRYFTLESNILKELFHK